MIIKVLYNSGMLCFRWELGDQKSNNEEVSILKILQTPEQTQKYGFAVNFGHVER